MHPAARRWPLVVVPLLLLAALLWWLRARDTADNTATDAPDTTASQLALAGPRDRPELALPALKNHLAALSGTVSDRELRPLVGAHVCARPRWDRLSSSERRDVRCTHSDRAGRYRLADLLGVDHIVTASAAGHIPETYHRGEGTRRRDTVALRPGHELPGVDLRLEGGGVQIHGTIKDLSGGPIDGALVSAGDAVSFSDADGNFSAWVRPGAASLTAQAQGYADGTSEGAAPGHAFEVFLTPESILIGKVVRADDGTPVADAWVSASGSYYQASYSDAGGNFRIDGLPPGPYKPQIEADAWFGRADEQVILGLGETSEPILVRAHPAVFVEGTIVGVDCDAARVSIHDDAANHFSFATAEPSGSYCARGVLPGDYEVSVSCPGFVPAETYPHVIVGATSITGLKWPMSRGQAIRGRVVDSAGAPVPQVHLAASFKPDPARPRAQITSASARSDDDGRFTLSGLLPGVYALRVPRATPARALPHVPIELTLLAGQHLSDVTIDLPATGELHGSVRDPQGRPIARVDITISADTDTQTTRADDQGNFHFPHLAAGDYRVVARRNYNDPLRAPGTRDDDVHGTRVRVQAGAREQVALVVEARSSKLAGVVRDSGGAPVSDAFIEATRESDSAAKISGGALREGRSGFSSAPTLTDLDGRFTIDGLADGKHTVRAHRRGGGEAILEHALPGDDIVLIIAETGRLAGTVTSPGGPSPEQFTLALRDPGTGFRRNDTFFRTAGAWSLAELPAGTYKLSFSASSGSADLEVKLAAGQETTDLRIELAPRVTVRGILVDLQGKPAAGLRVAIGGRNGGSWASSGAKQENVSDAAGRFELPGTPSGPAQVLVSPAGDSEFEFALQMIDVPTSAAIVDIPPISVPRKRLKPGDVVGDLGYRLKDADPGADPLQRRLQVALVRPGGPAALAGLRVGDEILAIDGHPLTAANWTLHTPLTRVPVGTIVQLTLASGATLPLTAAAKP